jgi:hypothetical protein
MLKMSTTTLGSNRKSTFVGENGGNVCNFISATQAGHKHKGSFVEGTLAVLITHVDGTLTFSQELKLSP